MTNYEKNSFITGTDLSYRGLIEDNPRESKEHLLPIFEAFTNSIESLSESDNREKYIKISLFHVTTLAGLDFDKIIIEDNGCGFNEENFNRFIRYKDKSKGKCNKGSGRLQYLHYFNLTTIESIYEESNKKYKRVIELSKKKEFLDSDAIIKHIETTICSISTDIKTKIVFTSPLLRKDKEYFNNLTVDELLSKLQHKYIKYFCFNKPNLPEIIVQEFVDNKYSKEIKLDKETIPTVDKKDVLSIKYRQNNDTNALCFSDDIENFELVTFVLQSANLARNSISLLVKDEISYGQELDLRFISNSAVINGNRYLFLLSSDYLTKHDGDERGVKLSTLKELNEKGWLFGEKHIVIEDITNEINNKIVDLYPEIKQQAENYLSELDKLRKMFLLNPKHLKTTELNGNLNEEKILKHVYEYDAKLLAVGDAKIKKEFDKLDNLNPISKTYEDDLRKITDNVITQIPIQNRTSLTHYVARRKLVLNLFDKILTRELDKQKSGQRNIDEKLLHNLIFKQTSTDVKNSDLWLINEDFIYFNGGSEEQLSKLKIDGENVFKDSFSKEEERYLNSLGENRKIKRPDILLFPEECKCIIIELKAPHVNASEHLTQIDFYASLIRNHTEDKFQITTFYGYLLGESIEPRDVIGRISNYEESYQFDYLFRPSTKVIGFDDRKGKDGSIYTEVIKYSTLLTDVTQHELNFQIQRAAV
jgi:hypothetical protein